MTSRLLAHRVKVLMCLGMLGLVGFALHQEVWTNYASHVRATQVREQLLKSWRKGIAITHTDRRGGLEVRWHPERGPTQSDAFALLYIPRLADHVWATPVLEGVESPELDSGVGHYVGTAFPGQQGNFAVAGHRATFGEPFAYFDHLKRGDRVYVRTMQQWFVYVLDKNLKVAPRDVWVIAPIPGRLGQQVQSSHLLSLVTCDPRWGSVRRWVWWGHLVAAHSRNELPLEVRHIQALK